MFQIILDDFIFKNPRGKDSNNQKTTNVEDLQRKNVSYKEKSA